MAMFDRGPGTTWLHQNDLTDRGIPYQSMTGDDKNNVAMMIDKELRAGKIDMPARSLSRFSQSLRSRAYHPLHAEVIFRPPERPPSLDKY